MGFRFASECQTPRRMTRRCTELLQDTRSGQRPSHSSWASVTVRVRLTQNGPP